MELSNYLVISWLITYLGNLQHACTGIITHLLGTVDIPRGVHLRFFGGFHEGYLIEILFASNSSLPQRRSS